MRIAELDLIAFGHFDGTTLDFGKGQFHLIYGLNEAGKSTALKAIEDFFFGIDVRTTYDFKHPMAKMRIGAVLEDSDGRAIKLTRRKGNTKTLRNELEEALDETVLARLLGGLSRESFRMGFGLNHEDLIRGGKALLAGQGEVGQSLFAAELGNTEVPALLRKLEAGADAIYKPRGSTYALNQALSQYQAAVKEIGDLQLRPSEWEQTQQAVERWREEAARISDEIAKTRGLRDALMRIQGALPVLVRRDHALEEIARLVDHYDLPARFISELREASQDEQKAREASGQAERELRLIDGQLGGIAVDEAILGKAEAIRDLSQGIERYVKNTEHRRDNEVRRLGLVAQGGEEVRKIWRTNFEKAKETLRPKQPDRDRIEDLAERAGVNSERLRNAKEILADIARDERLKGEQLHVLGEPKSPANLKLVVARAQAAGDLESALEEATSRQTTLESERDVRLPKLPLWSGSLDQLERIRVPSHATVSRFQTRLLEAETDRGALLKQRDDAVIKRKESEVRLRSLELAGRVPTEQELESSRAFRDGGWRLIKQVWLHNEHPEAEISEFAKSADLPDAYEAAVKVSDELADRLRREQERVVERARAQADLEGADAELERLKAVIEEAEASVEGTRGEWANEWKAAGIEPQSPAEMAEWLDELSGLGNLAGDMRKAKQEVERLRRLMSAHSAAITDAMVEIDIKPKVAASFAGLLGQAIQVVADLEEQGRRKTQLDADLAELASQRERREEEVSAVEGAIADWQRDWAEAVKVISLPPETTPTTARSALKTLTAFETTVREAGTLDLRVKGMDRDIEDFTKSVMSVAREVAPELTKLSPDSTARELASRLKTAEDAQATKKTLSTQRGRWSDEKEEAERKIAAADEKLISLMTEAQVTTREELAEAAERASELAEWRKQQRECEESLLKMGAGWDLDEFVRRRASIDLEALPTEIQRLDDKLEELDRQHTAAVEQRRDFESKLAAMDGSGRAAEASERAQGLAAIIEDQARDYVTKKLAYAVLKGLIERYREANQAPILKRAGEIFSRITLGAYARLKTEGDDKGQVMLVAVVADGEEKRVEQLSDGTRDQLYLALRLATYQRLNEAGRALPLILDDILVNCDDPRAEATLGVLTEVARDAQILFFTHHDHMVALAHKAVPADVLSEHKLQGPIATVV